MDEIARGNLMLKEIREQPAAIARLADAEIPRIAEMADHWRQNPPRFIFIAARGTSDHAALYAKYLFETMNGIPVGLAAPSIATVYKTKVSVEGSLIIGISQSGEAADVNAVLEQANRDGADTLAITNVDGSPISVTAKHTICLHAGPERAVAATKTYTSTLAALLLLSATLGQNAALRTHLERLPEYLEAVLRQEEQIRARVERFRYLDECVVLGRGYNLATAYELSLKLRETCYIRAQPFASPDFVHGPIAILDEGYPVIAFANEGPTLTSVLDVLGKIVNRGAEAVVVGNAQQALDFADVPIPVGVGMDLPEFITPFPCIVAGQILAQALSVIKGLDPDAPRGLNKVTITR